MAKDKSDNGKAGKPKASKPGKGGAGGAKPAVRRTKVDVRVATARAAVRDMARDVKGLIAGVKSNRPARQPRALAMAAAAPMGGGPPDDAIAQLQNLVRQLSAAFDTLKALVLDPDSSLDDQRKLLKQAALYRTEILVQTSTLNHLQAMTDPIQPPPPGAADELANALESLQRMQDATSTVQQVLTLAETVITHAENFRQGVDASNPVAAGAAGNG